MKKFLLLLIAGSFAIAFGACKKCHDCKTDVTTYQKVNGYEQTTFSSSTDEECGTAKEIEEFEKAGTYTVNQDFGSTKQTVTSTRTCTKN